MEFEPATEDDLAEVERAADEFRSAWASRRSMPFPAPFDGGPGDVRALDYLDYESLAYPPGGVAAAAAVGGIRELDETGSILVLGAEPDGPVYRPDLSKKLWLDKDASLDKAWLQIAR